MKAFILSLFRRLQPSVRDAEERLIEEAAPVEDAAAADPFRGDIEPSSQALRELFLAGLEKGRATAEEHIGEAYWTDYSTGHNVGEDEMQAVRFMSGIDAVIRSGRNPFARNLCPPPARRTLQVAFELPRDRA